MADSNHSSKRILAETEGSWKDKWQQDPLGKFLVKYFWGPKFRQLFWEQAALLTSWLSVYLFAHKPHKSPNFSDHRMDEWLSSPSSSEPFTQDFWTVLLQRAKLPIRQCQQMNQKENWFHSEVNLLCGHFRAWWQRLKMFLYFSLCRLFFLESCPASDYFFMIWEKAMGTVYLFVFI